MTNTMTPHRISDRPLAATLALLTALCVVSGCDAVSTGDNGTLTFRHAGEERVVPLSFETPIAAGLSLDVQVALVGSDRPPTLSTATSASPAVADVLETAETMIRVIGRRPGSAKIEVEATQGNDTFELTVANLRAVELSAPSLLVNSDLRTARVAVGGVTRLPVRLVGDDDVTLIGYGDLPIVADGARVTRVDTEDTAHVSYRADEAGTATLMPEGAAAIELQVLSLDEVVGLALDPVGAATFAADQSAFFVLRGRDAGDDDVFGIGALADLRAEPASVCTLDPAPRFGDSAFELTGVNAGDCVVTATLDEREPSLTATMSWKVTAP